MAGAYGWTETPDPTACRVCGWDLGEPGWDVGEPGRDPAPVYIICVCCGAESGVDDREEPQARAYLLSWIAGGARWFLPEEMPDDWSLVAHLDRVGIPVRRSELRRVRG